MALADKMGKTAFNLRVKLGEVIITLNTILFLGSMAFMCIEIYKKIIEIYEAWKEYRKKKAGTRAQYQKNTAAEDTLADSNLTNQSLQTLSGRGRRRKISSLRHQQTLDTTPELLAQSSLNLTLENEVFDGSSQDQKKSRKSKNILGSYHSSVIRRRRRNPQDFSEENNNVQKALFSGRDQDLSLQPSLSNPYSQKRTEGQEEFSMKVLEEDKVQTKGLMTDLSPFQVQTLESNFRNDDTRSVTTNNERRARRIAEANPITDLITYEPEVEDLQKRTEQIDKNQELVSEFAQRRNERLKVRKGKDGKYILGTYANKL